MKKIVFISAFQEGVLRGAETFTKELARQLAKTYQVDIIAGHMSPGKRWPFLWRTFLDPNGLSVFAFTISKIAKIWKGRYDIVIPVNGGWMPAIIRLVTWLYGGKMIISGQSGIGWDERNNLWCFPNAFVALSPKALKWARSVNPMIKSYYIPNGVDTQKFTIRGAANTFGLNRPIVLCVAALALDKRIDLTIKAVAKIPKATLLLVGSLGEGSEIILSYGKRILGKRFVYKSLAHEKMPAVYRGSDVFTLVSKSFFSFEIAIIEALASGLPVVINDDPIRRKIAGDTAIYVNPSNTAGYQKALLQAINKGKDKTLTVMARKFDWQVIAKKYVTVFQKMV